MGLCATPEPHPTDRGTACAIRSFFRFVSFEEPTRSALIRWVLAIPSSAAMELLQAGVDSSVIALWLGHESIETTQIYLHAHLALKEGPWRSSSRTTGASERVSSRMTACSLSLRRCETGLCRMNLG